MKKIVCLLVIFLMLSCTTYKREKFSYTTNENPWINAYKDHMFYACLNEGYQNDSIFELMKKRDLFNPYDEIDFDEIDSARANGKKIIKNMPKPWHCDDCKGNENYISANCLHYYASRELDSIARISYKAHLKRRKK